MRTQSHWFATDTHTSNEIRTRRQKNLAAIADVFFENAKGPPPEKRMAWLVFEVEDFMSKVGGKGRFVFNASLFAVTTLSPLMALRPWPLRYMQFETRILALKRFEKSPLGMALFAVKSIMAIIYYEHPDAAREIGFLGGCLNDSEPIEGDYAG